MVLQVATGLDQLKEARVLWRDLKAGMGKETGMKEIAAGSASK